MEMKKDKMLEERIEDYKYEFKYKLSKPLTNIGLFIAICKDLEINDEDFKIMRGHAENGYKEILNRF